MCRSKNDRRELGSRDPRPRPATHEPRTANHEPRTANREPRTAKLMHYPAKLQQLLETFDMFPDPADRTGMLLSYSDQFREVPPDVARRPFPKSHQVPQC